MVNDIGTPGTFEIGYAGLAMFWVTFGFMAFAAVTFAILTFMRPLHQRSHGYITTAIVTIASIAYYAMASHGGSALTANPYNDVRDIFYARYIDWFFTTPLLLLDILLLTGIPLGVTLWIVLADVAMIVLGLFGALSTQVERWGYFGLSCLFFFIVLWGIFGPGLLGVRRQSRALTSTYMGLAGYLGFLWFGYPIVWGLAEGSSVISVDAECIAYGLLDIFAKVFFGFAVMLAQPVILKNPVTSGSWLTNSTNSPFVAGPVDGAEKGLVHDRATRPGPVGTGTGTGTVGAAGTAPAAERAALRAA